MVRILHAADLHLDSPFSGLTPEQAAERRWLQRQLLAHIAELAGERQCDLLLLAGDVFDGARVCPETIEAMVRAFGRFRGHVFIAPGNHDPYHDRSPWALTVWPENVHIFTGKAEAVELPDCRVWGGAFTSPECYDGLPTVRPYGKPQIGVFHGDPETPGPYRWLSAEEIGGCGLDYLALGHIHRTQLPKRVGNTWVGWPGAAMGRGFDECGERGVCYTELDRGGCRTEFLPLPGPRYEKITVAYGETPKLPADSKEVICRLTVTGEADDPDFDGLRAALAPKFLSLELRDETVPVRDIWAAAGDGTLRGLTLSALKRQWDSGEADAALAARYVLAALEGRESP